MSENQESEDILVARINAKCAVECADIAAKSAEAIARIHAGDSPVREG